MLHLQGRKWIEYEVWGAGRELSESKLMRGNGDGDIENKAQGTGRVLSESEPVRRAAEMLKNVETRAGTTSGESRHPSQGINKAEEGVTSRVEETELTGLHPGSCCCGIKCGEMGRKGTGSPCEDSDLENSGDSELSRASSIVDEEVDDSCSQDLEDWLRVPGSNDWSGDRATGSESSVEISSRGKDKRVDDERRGASVSSGGSDSARGDRPNFENSDVDAGSDSG
ncbi:hypothetical protein EDB85DRAFT_2222792 [Lactarius pseudohatsudake]|nr:hypothetical protein EDB85DRAFT_2222792 [Lactarius pseudohatsudake]